jgi:hypothetical protein
MNSVGVRGGYYGVAKESWATLNFVQVSEKRLRTKAQRCMEFP